jgi:flagellin-like hook-associated protein FlgL
MSGIVLSASVRQNLLSLQSTASLLATTQDRLATGKKVNSALDNPTNFFTAQGLDNRASDISNLLDGIGNGIQVLQAANTGITSLQKLVDSAKSIASQVLQSPVGYVPRSGVTSTAIAGATATNLLGSLTNATATGAVVNNDNTGGAVPITAATQLVGTASATSNDLGTAITNGSTLTVDGKTITFSTSQTNVTGDGQGDFTIGIGAGSTLKVSDVLAAVDNISGATVPSTVTGGKLVLSTGTTQNLVLGGAGNALAALGLTAGTTNVGSTAGVTGETLTIGATGGGTPTNITFGTGLGQISNLNELNAALAANNLQASIDTTGKITITTTNDSASSTIGAIGGSAAAAGAPFAGLTASAPVADPDSQATRANLVSQFNNVLAQINTTSQDSSFNGVNLLNGDTLKLVFNETGKSTLSITGVVFDAGGLGLSNLAAGTDFLDSASANKALAALDSASTTLRSEASALGSNLSIVQIRQDFNKNLINVLQTGSSNLTLADTNEEAANSQALSTRQSIAVSALALANQSQASVLQLLR